MPPGPVTIGVEFEAMSVSNGDGGSVTVFIKVLDGTPTVPGQFEARSVQTGPSSATFVLRNPDLTVWRTFACPPGNTNLVNLPGGFNTSVTWAVARQRVELQSATR